MMRPRNYTAAVVAIALTALPSPVGAQGTKPPMSANEDVSEQSQEASPIIDEGEEAPQDNVQDILETMTTRLARERNQEGINALNSTPPNLPKALEAFQAAYSLNRDDVEVVNNLGFVYAELGNLTRAEPLLRRALEQSPERLVAHVNLADVLIEKGADAALGEAKTLLARARELAGNDPELITRQATVHRRLGEEASALRLYREAVDLDPDNHELFVTLGDYFRELARDDQAADWYTRVPKQSEFYVRAKERLEQLEVERAARRYGWSPATRAVSRRVKTFVRRADELLGRGQLVAAEELARQAVQEAPQYADSHRVLGDALAAQGQAALSTYLRGFAVEPSNADLVRRIALIYRQENRDAEASVLLSRALELRPDWSELQLDLALALRSSGDLPGALKQVNRFLNSGLDVPRAEEATNL
ncbi:MAG: tetratricopeptide repeat protein, partial [Myxococcota bacterium]